MREIPLTQGLVAIVDDEDYEFLSQWKWYAGKERDGKYRAMRKQKEDGKWRTIYMHRVILNAPRGVVIDHINGDSLDNRKANLRICSARQNSYNKQLTPKTLAFKRSLFKGVSRQNGRWRARIFVNGKQIHLGLFDTEVEAALAYDRAAREYFGEFAWLNFPQLNFPHKENAKCIDTNRNSRHYFPTKPNGSLAEALTS